MDGLRIGHESTPVFRQTPNESTTSAPCPHSPGLDLSQDGELIGRGLDPIRGILRELVRTPVTFLLSGPSGSGKDHLARAFHRLSSRSSAPFFAVNCAAIPDSLFESHLFGHKKGAFTGADSDRAGILESAQGGFVLLNEITDIPFSAQPKLLQVIEDKVMWRIGESTPRRVDVLIAAASNRTDLLAMTEDGQFRKDLYYRLSRIAIHLPPLCERIEDLPSLAEFFSFKASRELNRRPVRFSHAAMEVLKGFAWPGNVREFENLVHELTVTHEGETIEVELLPQRIKTKSESKPRHKITRTWLRRVLAQKAWNVTQAAESSGYSREHFYVLMRKHGICRPGQVRVHL